MTEIIYKHSFGNKNRNAVRKFVSKVSEKIDFVGKPKALFGPERQVVVCCTIKGRSAGREKAMRSVMAKASQQVLTSDDIWIVGLPEKSSKKKSLYETGK